MTQVSCGLPYELKSVPLLGAAIKDQREHFLRAAGVPQALQGLRNLFYCRLLRKQTR